MQNPRKNQKLKKTNLLDTSWTQHWSTLEVACAQLGRSFHWNRSTLTTQSTGFQHALSNIITTFLNHLLHTVVLKWIDITYYYVMLQSVYLDSFNSSWPIPKAGAAFDIVKALQCFANFHSTCRIVGATMAPALCILRTLQDVHQLLPFSGGQCFS